MNNHLTFNKYGHADKSDNYCNFCFHELLEIKAVQELTSSDETTFEARKRINVMNPVILALITSEVHLIT